jgi:hypothetical protein
MYKNPLQRKNQRKRIVHKVQDSVAENTKTIQHAEKPVKKRGVAVSTWKAYCAIRRNKKMSNVVTSKTTQNVTMGTAASGGAIYGVIAFLRSYAPNIVFWGEDADAGIVVVATTIIAPLVSRIIAMVRNPEKKGE